MGNSVIDRLVTNFTDATLPKLYRSLILNTGSQFLFNFTDPYSNPNPDGNLAQGATFLNMVDGAAGATIVGNSSTFASLPGRAGLSVPGVGASNPTTYVDLGTNYSLAGNNHDFLYIVWAKTPAAGFVTPYPQIVVHGPFANEGQDEFSLSTGADGKSPRGSVANAAGAGASVAGASGTGLGTPLQIGFSRVGSTLSLSLNNVAAGTVQLPGAGGLYNASGQSVKLGGGYKGTLYTVYKEDLTVSAAASGTTPAQQAANQIAADYAANNGQFA